MANSTTSSDAPAEESADHPSVMPITPEVITVMMPISSEMRAP